MATILFCNRDMQISYGFIRQGFHIGPEGTLKLCAMRAKLSQAAEMKLMIE